MARKKLLIVESPAKARTIGKILGKDFIVKASVGHVRDLPKNSLGVDEEDDFEPQYQVLPEKEAVVTELRRAAKKADEIFVATDPDREGEAIGWHIIELLEDQGHPLRRVEFHEITKRAVKEAFEQPREVDMPRVDAQQARRVIDRLVGYRLSPLLWDKVKRGLSAGRVQSVALKMVCDREAEIDAFQEEEYWLVDALVDSGEKPEFSVRLAKKDGRKWRPTNEAEAEAVKAAAVAGPLKVTRAARRKRTQTPKSPFITSHLQQEASRRLRLPVRRTMQLAQRLYEGVDLGAEGQTGLITYMRTDSVRVSDESVAAAREMIASRFGEAALPEKPRVYSNKSASQDAHEAIRPTDPKLTPDHLAAHLKADELRLYRLIWERFVASQMKQAVFDVTQIDVAAGDYTLAVTGKILREPGFLSLWQDVEEGNGESQNGKGVNLPPGIVEGQELECRSVKLEQKWTQPPARYGEATLVKALEENGIGRPSTYASILATLASRDYTVREKNSFRPTELGKLVNRLLVGSFANIINETYTASLEKDLDRVAAGQHEWKDLVRTFSTTFASDLDQAREEMEQVKGRGVATDQICPECSSPLVMKFGRYGEFLACSAYPECSYTRDLNEDDSQDVDEETPSCPECSTEMVLKRSRFGPFWACTRFPDCRGTRRIGGDVAQQPQSTGVSCPRADCDGEIVQRKSRRGKVFYGCKKYPSCDYSMWDAPVSTPCPVCGHAIMGLRVTQKRGRELVCPLRDCGHRMPAPDEEASEPSSS